MLNPGSRFRRRLPLLPKRRKPPLRTRRSTRSEDQVESVKEDKDETDNDHEATDHPEDPERLVSLLLSFCHIIPSGR